MKYISDSAPSACTCLSSKISLANIAVHDLQNLTLLIQNLQRYLKDLLNVLHTNGGLNIILYADSYATPTNLPLLTFTSLLIAEVTVIFLLSYHTLLGLMYFRVKSKILLSWKQSSRQVIPNGGGKYLLTVVIPIKNEPLDLVVRTVRDGLRNLREADNVEILVISDDSEDYVEELAGKLPYRNVRVIKRGGGGGRSAALDYGFRLARGTYVMYVDADARLGPEISRKIISSLGNHDVLVIPWRGYYSRRTKLGEALAYITTMYSFMYHTLRSALNLFVFPLGSGTIYKKEVLESVNGWGPRIIQDDIWLGTKLATKGIEPKVLNGCYLDVLVPCKYTAFRIQQCRWAYGTSEVLSKMFWRFVKAPISTIKKLEMIVYMLQPAVSIPVLASMLLATVAALSEGHVGILALINSPIAMALGVTIVVLTALYSIIEIRIARDLGLGSTKKIAFMMGRQAAFHSSLIPLLAIYSALGFIRKRIPYRITPKGSREDVLGIDTPLLVMALTAIGMFTICVLTMNFVTALMLFAFLSPYIYTLVNFSK